MAHLVGGRSATALVLDDVQPLAAVMRTQVGDELGNRRFQVVDRNKVLDAAGDDLAAGVDDVEVVAAVAARLALVALRLLGAQDGVSRVALGEALREPSWKGTWT